MISKNDIHFLVRILLKLEEMAKLDLHVFVNFEQPEYV